MKKQSQNKPNFQKAQNERKLICYRGLQKKRRFRSPKKQTQFKPNLLDAQMSLNFYSTKDYENQPRLPAPGKQTQYGPTQTRSEFIPKGAEIPTGELLGTLKPGTNF